MRSFLTLIGKTLAEARWTLLISAVAMFLFGWLNTYVISFQMARFRARLEQGGGEGLRMIREMAGQGADLSVAMFEMMFWLHPFIWLPVVVWAVGRGSLAVAGELERGTLDLVLSRPIARWAYLYTQVLVAGVGLVLIPAALVAGNRISTRFNPVDDPPSAGLLFWPALNLALLGAAIFGITLVVSASDRVRWRATLVGTVVTTGGFAAWLISNLRDLADSPVRRWLRPFALFELFNPVDAVGAGRELAFNLTFLAGLALGGVAAAFLAFLWRDLPASG